MEINKIYNEPCLETIYNMADDFIHLTITSPPYNLGEKHHTRDNVFNSYDTYTDNLDENVYQNEQIKVLNEIYRATKEGGSLMYNHKNRIKNGFQITPYEWLLKTKWTIKQELVWWNGTPNMDKCRFYPSTERIYWLSKGTKTKFYNATSSNDLIKDMPVGTEGEHKRSFPLKLAQRFIICFPDSEIVYDPYMGSGTTAVACLKEKRNYIGSEISKKYCELANLRIEKEKSQLLLF